MLKSQAVGRRQWQHELRVARRRGQRHATFSLLAVGRARDEPCLFVVAEASDPRADCSELPLGEFGIARLEVKNSDPRGRRDVCPGGKHTGCGGEGVFWRDDGVRQQGKQQANHQVAKADHAAAVDRRFAGGRSDAFGRFSFQFVAEQLWRAVRVAAKL